MKRHQTSVIVWSISGRGGEEEILDGAPGSGDARYGCCDAKFCACASKPSHFSFLLIFPLFLSIVCTAIKDAGLLLDLGMNVRPPAAEMCLILRAIMMPFPGFFFFLNSCSLH